MNGFLVKKKRKLRLEELHNNDNHKDVPVEIHITRDGKSVDVNDKGTYLNLFNLFWLRNGKLTKKNPIGSILYFS